MKWFFRFHEDRLNIFTISRSCLDVFLTLWWSKCFFIAQLAMNFKASSETSLCLWCSPTYCAEPLGLIKVIFSTVVGQSTEHSLAPSACFGWILGSSCDPLWTMWRQLSHKAPLQTTACCQPSQRKLYCFLINACRFMRDSSHRNIAHKEETDRWSRGLLTAESRRVGGKEREGGGGEIIKY